MNKEQKATKNKNTEEKIGGGKRLLGKVLCALLALVLWVYVSYDKRPETSKVFAKVKNPPSSRLFPIFWQTLALRADNMTLFALI